MIGEPKVPAGHEPWEDRIIEALDGRASGSVLEELERHLSTCEPCRSVREEYRALVGGLRESAAEEPPAAFWDELATAIEARLDATESAPWSSRAAGAPTSGTAAPPASAAGAPRQPGVFPIEARAGRGGRRTVIGGVLAAACLAVAILSGLYLALPRSGASPQAFTSAVAPPPPAAAGLAAGETEPGAGSRDTEVLEEVLPQLAASPEPRDPLAVLADPDALLDSLSPEEAAELLDLMESST